MFILSQKSKKYREKIKRVLELKEHLLLKTVGEKFKCLNV